jgi:hypothetical protein
MKTCNKYSIRSNTYNSLNNHIITRINSKNTLSNRIAKYIKNYLTTVSQSTIIKFKSSFPCICYQNRPIKYRLKLIFTKKLSISVKLWIEKIFNWLMSDTVNKKNCLRWRLGRILALRFIESDLLLQFKFFNLSQM